MWGDCALIDMNLKDIRVRALRILAAERYGVLTPCDCGDSKCDRNYPGAENVAWARGVVETLGTPKEEIEAACRDYKARLDRPPDGYWPPFV